MFFLDLKSESFGLDISDLSLKAAKLKKRGKFSRLLSWGHKDIPENIIEQGEVKNEEALAQNINELLSKISGQKIKTKNVIVSLPEKKSFVQVIKMPKMTKEELEAAIPFEAENYIPFSLDEVYLDFQIIPALRENGFINVLVAAVPKSIVDSYLRCVKKAGLYPLAFEIESQPISRALIKDGFSPFPVLIVDIGRSNTNLIVFSGNSPCFSSSIPFSSYAITQTIAQKLQKDLLEADRIKIKYGLQGVEKRKNIKDISEPGDIPFGTIFETISPIMSDLVAQMEKYITYYQTHSIYEHSSQRKIKKILLCGKGANLKGLEGFIYSSIKIPAEKGNPWVNILPPPVREIPELPFEDSLGYTTSFGLALRGIKED